MSVLIKVCVTGEVFGEIIVKGIKVEKVGMQIDVGMRSAEHIA